MKARCVGGEWEFEGDADDILYALTALGFHEKRAAEHIVDTGDFASLEDFRRHVGVRVSAYMALYGIERKRFAEAGISGAALFALRNGTSSFSIGTLWKVSRVLGVSVRDLMAPFNEPVEKTE